MMPVTMNSSRPPSEELIRRLSKYDLSVGELALQTRDLVLEALPDAVESLFESYALVFWYSLSGRMGDSYCYVAVFSKHVNLGFSRGAELKDSVGLLEGDGKIMRHIKIRTAADLKNPQLRSLVRAAEKNARQVAASKPERPPKTKARASSKRR